MTEFKKLTALLAEMQAAIDELLVQSGSGLPAAAASDAASETPSSSSGIHSADAEQLYALATRVKTDMLAAAPRVRKLTLKAREKDPDRQIYNEMMCGKIEQLMTDYCVQLGRLLCDAAGTTPDKAACEQMVLDDTLPDFDATPLYESVERVYQGHMLRRAEAEAWQERVAKGFADVVLYEREGRVVVQAEEGNARTALGTAKQAEKKQVVQLLREQAEARWQAELQRRKSERTRLAEQACEVRRVGLAAYVAQALPQEALRRGFASHMHELAKALLRTPEDANIRRLRNNNEQLMRDYGHPCLTHTADDGGRDCCTEKDAKGNNTECACAAVVRTAEAVWAYLGYAVRYTATNVPPIQALLQAHALHDVTLPCGQPLSGHVYTHLGFEVYGERYFELCEPDATSVPDEWMSWYERVQKAGEELP